MKGTLRDIVVDGVILVIISSVVAIAANLAVTSLKKGGAKDDPIVTAIQQDNLEAVGQLAQADTNLADDFGRTALMRAAYANLNDEKGLEKQDKSRSAMVILLLDHGAKIDAVDKDGWTALMWASWSGMSEVANTLLSRGAAVTNADRQGNTALSIAAQRGNASIVEALVKKGADLSAKTKTGQSALDLAKSARNFYPRKKDAYQKTLRLLGGS